MLFEKVMHSGNARMQKASLTTLTCKGFLKKKRCAPFNGLKEEIVDFKRNAGPLLTVSGVIPKFATECGQLIPK